MNVENFEKTADVIAAKVTKVIASFSGTVACLINKSYSELSPQDKCDILTLARLLVPAYRDVEVCIESGKLPDRQFKNSSISMLDLHRYTLSTVERMMKEKEGIPELKAYLDALDNAGEYTNRGFSYLDKGQLDHAIVAFNKAVQLDPYCAIAYNNLGGAYLEKGDHHRAIDYFTKAIEIDPDTENVYNNRGTAYHAVGDECAIDDFEQAIKRNPNDARLRGLLVNSYFGRGFMSSQSGDYARAIPDYEKALKLDPKFSPAKLELEKARQSIKG